MPKIVDHEERRAHIVEAVTEIIMRDGFDRVTMREIAAEAGYAHGAITRYFPNKQSLLTAAFLHVFRESHIDAQLAGKRGLDGLRTLIGELLPADEERRRRARVVLTFWDRASQNAELWEIHDENIQRRRGLIRRLLTEAREDGELAAGVDIENEVNRISAQNAGWQMLAVLVPDAATMESVHSSIDATIDGLCANSLPVREARRAS